MKIWIFPPLAFVWPSKIFLAFFQFSWPSDILNIQNHSNLSYFEAILPSKQFLLKIWQSGSLCEVLLSGSLFQVVKQKPTLFDLGSVYL